MPLQRLRLLHQHPPIPWRHALPWLPLPLSSKSQETTKRNWRLAHLFHQAIFLRQNPPRNANPQGIRENPFWSQARHLSPTKTKSLCERLRRLPESLDAIRLMN